MSSVNNNNDPPRPLTANLPAFPGLATTQRGRKVAAPQQTPGLDALLRLLGDQTVADIQQTQKTSGGQKSKGQKYTGAPRTLPPPRAPRVMATPQTAAAYASLADELSTAVDSAQTRMAKFPQAQQPGPSLPNLGQVQDTDAAAQQAADWFAHNVSVIGSSSAGMMQEFMHLRLKNDSHGMQELQNICDLCTQIQDDELQMEQAKSKVAMDEAHKANKKAGLMGVLSKTFTLVIAVICVAAIAFSLGAGTGLALVAAAAAIGFLAGGLASGQKNGDGFDVWAGVNSAAIAIDIASFLVCVGPACMAVQATAKVAAEELSKEALTQGSKVLSQQLTEQGTRVAVEGAETQCSEATVKAINEALQQAADAGTRSGTETASGAATEAAKRGASQGATKAAESAGTSADRQAAKTAAETGAQESVAQVTSDMTNREAEQMLEEELVKQSKKEAEALSVKAKSAALKTIFKQQYKAAMESPLLTVGGKTVVPGIRRSVELAGGRVVLGASTDLGSSLMVQGLTLGLLQGAGSLTNAILNYLVTMHQTKSEEAQAQIKQCAAMVDLLNGEYNTVQNCIQALSQSHSSTVDAVQSMLKNNEQAALMIGTNLSSRG